MTASDAEREGAVAWAWLWPLVGAAFVLRVAVAWFTAAPLHPDEGLQYLEQGHRLAFGYGVVPWEYAFGIRSWALPAFIAGLLRFANLLGLSEPWLYIPFVETVFSALSLTLPFGMYRLGQIVLDERGARMALLFGCFWGHFVLYAHKPMPGVLTMYVLVWVAVWMLRPAGTARLLTIGALAGLAVVIRFQTLPVAGILGLWGIALYGWRVLIAYAAAALVVVAAGLLDLWTWGGFLFSFVQNFRLNFLLNLSAEFFGAQAPWFYAQAAFLETGGVILLAIPGLFLLPRRAWPVFGAMAVGVLALHIPDHKEFRFVIWALPFAFVAAAAFLAALLDRSEAIAQIAGPALLVGALGTGIAFAVVRAGWTPPGLLGQDWRLYNEAEEVFFTLARDPDLSGAELLTPDLRFWQTMGYYALHRPVPVYFWSWHNWRPEAERAAFRRFVSHVVTSGGEVPPPGFERMDEIGRFTIWKAATLPTPAPGAGLYDPRVPWRAALRELGPVPSERLRPPIHLLPIDRSR